MPSTNLQTIWKRFEWSQHASSEWWEEKQSKSGCPLSLAGSHCFILCFIIISLTFATVDSAVKFDHPCFYMVVSRVEGVRAGTLSRGRIWLKWRVELEQTNTMHTEFWFGGFEAVLFTQKCFDDRLEEAWVLPTSSLQFSPVFPCLPIIRW